MRIGLIDVDGHNFPNLALMKISAYHKARGDSVEWWNGLLHYDRVYQSKVFDETYSRDNEFVVQADEVIKGGTGYDLKNKLPDAIEHTFPDYGLYAIQNRAFGFLTRGCPRGCPFCIVKEKEGGKRGRSRIYPSSGTVSGKSSSWIQISRLQRIAKSCSTAS